MSFEQGDANQGPVVADTDRSFTEDRSSAPISQQISRDGRNRWLRPLAYAGGVVAVGLLITALFGPGFAADGQVQANIDNFVPHSAATTTAVTNEQARKDAEKINLITNYLEARLQAGVMYPDRAKDTTWTVFLAPEETYQKVRQETKVGLKVRDFPSEREGDTVLNGGTRNDPAIKTWTWGQKISGGPYDTFVKEENGVLGEEHYWTARFTSEGGDPNKPQPHPEFWRVYSRTPATRLGAAELTDFYQDSGYATQVGPAGLFLQPRATRIVSNSYANK